jgi:hypothetical protein
MMTESMSALQYGALNLGDQSHLHMGDGLTDEGRHLVHGQTIVLSWLGRDVGRDTLLFAAPARRASVQFVVHHCDRETMRFAVQICENH